MKKILVFLCILSLSPGCRFFRSGSDRTFMGPWAGEAQHFWNVTAANLENRGITVHSPSPLQTHFRDSVGTLGGGGDRMPFVHMGNQRVGGWWSGVCRKGADATVVRESGTGYVNPRMQHHETAHHVEHHARCEGGHPGYIHAPHWPHYTYRTLNVEFEENGVFTCITVVMDPDEFQIMGLEDIEGIRRELEPFARAIADGEF